MSVEHVTAYVELFHRIDQPFTTSLGLANATYRKVYEFDCNPVEVAGEWGDIESSPNKLCEAIFWAFNSAPARGGIHDSAPDTIWPDHPLYPAVAEYRNEGKRSISVGDLVVVGTSSRGINAFVFEVARFGFKFHGIEKRASL